MSIDRFDWERDYLRRLEDMRLSNSMKAKYGLGGKETAEAARAKLQEAFPEEKFTVDAHSWLGNQPLSWGVCRYVPYCEAMPFRNTGFVDFLEPEYARFAE